MIEILLGIIIIFSAIAKASLDLWALSFVYIISLIMLIDLVVKFNRGTYSFNRTSLDIPILIFLFFAVISVFFSVNKYLSNAEFYNIIIYILLYYVVITYAVTIKKRLLLINFIILAGFIVSLPAIYQNAVGIKNIYSTLVNPNILAGYMVPAIILSISLIIESINGISRGKNKSRLLWASICVLLMLTTLMLTRSVGGVLSLYVGLLTMLLIYLKYRRPEKWASKLLNAAALVVVVLGFILILYKSRDPEVSNRFFWWLGALKIIIEKPFTGVGIGCFGDIYLKYKAGGLNSLYAHNHFLQMAAEIGIMGMGAFLLIIVAAFKSSLRWLKEESMFFEKMGLISAMVAVLSFNLVDYSLSIPANAFIFWIIMGLMVRPAPFSVKINGNRMRLMANFIFVVFVLVAGGLVARNFLASQKLSQGLILLREGEQVKSKKLLQSSMSLNESNPEVYMALSDVFVSQGEIEAAIEQLRKGTSLVPHNAFFHYRLGLLYQRKGLHREAVSELKKASSLHYNNILYHVTLSNAYKRLGDINSSRAQDRIVESLQRVSK
ncbi:MAG: O-antigen ligase family protein [bacterium]